MMQNKTHLLRNTITIVSIILTFVLIQILNISISTNIINEIQEGEDRTTRTTALVDEEEEQKDDTALPTIAYGFNAYEGDMYSIPVSIAAVFNANNVYCVQLDASVSPDQATELKELIVKSVLDWNRGDSTDHNCHDAKCVEARIKVLIGRFSNSYGGISQPLAVMDVMEELLEFDSEWDFFINLTPLDYPLARQTDIRKILASVGKNSFNGFPDHRWSMHPTPDYQPGEHFDKWHDIYFDPSLLHKREDHSDEKLELMRLPGSIPKEIVDSDFMMVLQSEFFGVWHRSFIEYVLRSPLSRRAIALLSHGKNTSEKLFQTILYNSNTFPHCPSNLRGNSKTMGPFISPDQELQDVGGYPEAETVDFLSKSTMLFYRKFPQIHDIEKKGKPLADEYSAESYRKAVRDSFRDDSSKYTETWKRAMKERIDELLPLCVIGIPPKRSGDKHFHGTIHDQNR